MIVSSRIGSPARRCGLDGADTLPDLSTAFQEQLGLKLDTTKAPANVLVIDNVSNPSEN